jgi:nicotinamidase-related amidase
MNQALLVIDAQQDLINGSDVEVPVFEKARLLKNINKVINKALESDIPIVFIRDKSVANGEGKGFQVHEEINVPPNAPTFDKSANNSFYQTPLLAFLQDHDIGHLVITGCSTDYCIDSAVRTATIHGFDVTLVGDAHSTPDSPILSAEQIIKHHNQTLHGLSNVDHFSLVRNSEDDLFQPIHDNYR